MRGRLGRRFRANHSHVHNRSGHIYAHDYSIEQFGEFYANTDVGRELKNQSANAVAMLFHKAMVAMSR
jgi:hypothetical protein